MFAAPQAASDKCPHHSFALVQQAEDLDAEMEHAMAVMAGAGGADGA